jgi:endonuclease III
MEDVGGEEDEDENDGESIEYIEIDDDESTYQPLDLLCRGVPKIESSSFDAEARNFFNSMNDDGDRKIIKDSTVLFERQSNTMTALEKLYFEERRMWDNFAKKPLTKKRFSEKEAWIECSNENCGKWRRVPKGMSNALLVHGKTLNEHSAEVEYLNWTCSRSFDNRYNSCEKVQEMENDDIDELVRDAEKMRIDDEEKRANDKKMREKKEKLRVEREVLKQQATTRVELNRREKRANTEKLKALAQDARDRPDFLFDEITTSDDIIVHDSVDWYRVLHEATTDEIVECIRCRGMHFMLAERIKKILKRVLDERGVLSLEFLRQASTEEARAYLHEIEGMGAKTSACVNLLSLENRDFPVDVNVGRIMARLGWVPLEDDFDLNLIEQYAPEESVYEFLSDRLNTFDVTMLYELHYHMITLGKVFCSKRDPNCASCPMNSDCYYAKCGGKRRNNNIMDATTTNVGVPPPPQSSTPQKDTAAVIIDLTKPSAAKNTEKEEMVVEIRDIEDLAAAASPSSPKTPSPTRVVTGKRFPSFLSMESPSSEDGFDSPTSSQKTAAMEVEEDALIIQFESDAPQLSSSSSAHDDFASNITKTMDSIIAAGKLWSDSGKFSGKAAMRVLLLLPSDDEEDENKSAVAAMIMRQYKSLSKLCHPDKNRNDLERASNAFGILAEAKAKAMDAVTEVDARTLKDDAAFESEAEDEVLREAEDPRFAKLTNISNRNTSSSGNSVDEKDYLTPNRFNQLADLSSFAKTQFRSEAQGWRIPDECVPKELLDSLAPHPTTITGEYDEARKFCVIAVPRDASEFERVYKKSTTTVDNSEGDSDIIMQSNAGEEECEEEVIVQIDDGNTARAADVIVGDDPFGEQSLATTTTTDAENAKVVKCVFFVTALCACRRSFPLHGTYFQVNEVFLDLRSAAEPVDIDLDVLKNSPKIITLLGASIGSVTRGMTRTEVTRLFNHQVLCVRAWERKTGYPRELPKWICSVIPMASTGQEFKEYMFPSPLLHPEKSTGYINNNNNNKFKNAASTARKLGRPKKKQEVAAEVSIAINREPAAPETPFNNDIFRSYLQRKLDEKKQKLMMNTSDSPMLLVGSKRKEDDSMNVDDVVVVESGSGDEEKKVQNHPKKRRKTKKVVYPLIKSSEKCGKCANCLNPQKRKPCLTARANQKKKMLAFSTTTVTLKTLFSKMSTPSPSPSPHLQPRINNT